jgi:hypothetical protein
MKAKKFPKKLRLNKTTVANLGNTSMNGLRGGRPLTSVDDPYRCYTKCDTGVCCGLTGLCGTQDTLGICCNPELTVDAGCVQTFDAACGQTLDAACNP